MGAGQSSSNGTTAAVASQEVKTSYYELLAIHRQATEEEIKKAYRRKALELHPDRNFGNEEAATKTFAEIQAAYEVLSDPQERAWYDSHESAILRGEDPDADDAPSYEDVRITTADDLARLLRKFNSNVAFTDAPSGFFGFVRDTFEHLAREEDAAGARENVDVREYPTFGHKDDVYDDVVKQFYTAWSNFATIKTFSWKDKYRLSEAPDRWYRRRMEQENARIRQDARREFNDAVRSLVAFVKKRDPRYVPNAQSEQERQQTLRDAAASQAARARAANLAKLEGDVPEWTKVREPEELEESEDEDEEQEVLECVACNKVFKSERQWEAHERSKKHQKAVRSLQQKMRKENATLDLEAESDIDEIRLDTINGDHDSASERNKSQEPSSTGTDRTQHRDMLDDTASANELAEPVTLDKKQTSRSTDGDLGSPASQHNAHLQNDSDSNDDSDYAPLEAVQARMHSATLASSIASPGATSDSETEASRQQSQRKVKVGKAAQKRAKKAAAAAASQDGEAKASQRCEVCNADFTSRTLLFKHINEEGHAAVKVAGGGSGGDKRKKKGKAK